MVKKQGTLLKILSRLLGLGVIIFFGIFLFVQGTMFLQKKKMLRYDKILVEQKKELADMKNYTGYTTLMSIEELETKKVQLPWSQHIRQILDILQDLKAVSNGSNKTIVLSDFEVGLDSIKLNGQVTTLKALYYNSSSGKFRSLFDRFQDLDFIRDLEIKNYEKKEQDGKYYNFVLHAKVITDEQ